MSFRSNKDCHTLYNKHVMNENARKVCTVSVNTHIYHHSLYDYIYDIRSVAQFIGRFFQFSLHVCKNKCLRNIICTRRPQALGYICIYIINFYKHQNIMLFYLYVISQHKAKTICQCIYNLINIMYVSFACMYQIYPYTILYFNPLVRW